MQPLEQDKNPVEMLTINSQTVVPDGKYPLLLAVLPGGDMHSRGFYAVILDGIPNEVLEYLNQLRIVCGDGWQRTMSYNRTALLNHCLQVCNRRFQRVFTGNLAERLSICPRARICQQVLD